MGIVKLQLQKVVNKMLIQEHIFGKGFKPTTFWLLPLIFALLLTQNQMIYISAVKIKNPLLGLNTQINGSSLAFPGSCCTGD